MHVSTLLVGEGNQFMWKLPFGLKLVKKPTLFVYFFYLFCIFCILKKNWVPILFRSDDGVCGPEMAELSNRANPSGPSSLFSNPTNKKITGRPSRRHGYWLTHQKVWLSTDHQRGWLPIDLIDKQITNRPIRDESYQPTWQRKSIVRPIRNIGCWPTPIAFQFTHWQKRPRDDCPLFLRRRMRDDTRLDRK